MKDSVCTSRLFCSQDHNPLYTHKADCRSGGVGDLRRRKSVPFQGRLDKPKLSNTQVAWVPVPTQTGRAARALGFQGFPGRWPSRKGWSPTNWKSLPTLPSAFPLPSFTPLVASLPSFPKVLVCGSLCDGIRTPGVGLWSWLWHNTGRAAVT